MGLRMSGNLFIHSVQTYAPNLSQPIQCFGKSQSANAIVLCAPICYDVSMTDIFPNLPPAPTPIPVVSQPEAERELYAWVAPSRLYKKRNREFYTTVGALVFLISIILLFAKEFLLIGVIFSLGFVSYVLASIKPEQVTHQLTNKGIRTSGKLYFWPTMSRFWWEDKWKQTLLHLLLPGQYPGSVILLLGDGNKKQIEEITSRYLVKEKPAPTWIDNASKWLQEKVPLESEENLPPHPPKASSA